MSIARPEGFDRNSKLQRNLNWMALGRVIGVEGGGMLETEEGVIIIVNPATAGFGSDLRFVASSYNDAGTLKVQVSAGLVNNLLAANFGAYLTAISGTNYLSADCLTDGKKVTSFTLELSGTPPDPIDVEADDPPDAFEVLLCVVSKQTVGSVTTIAFQPVIQRDLVATPYEAFLESLTTAPDVGLLPFTRWWTWYVQTLA